MTAIKVHFGGNRPANIDYKRFNGMAEVWLYRNITQEQTEEGTNWVADGVFFSTAQTQDEVLANFDSYFTPDAPSAEDKRDAQVLYTALMTDTLLED